MTMQIPLLPLKFTPMSSNMLEVIPSGSVARFRYVFLCIFSFFCPFTNQCLTIAILSQEYPCRGCPLLFPQEHGTAPVCGFLGAPDALTRGSAREKDGTPGNMETLWGELIPWS